MAAFPSFENALLEVHQSLGLKQPQSKLKDKLVHGRLELQNHLGTSARLLGEIFAALDLDASASASATLNIEDWAGFHTGLEAHTWTFDASPRQVVWHLLACSWAPGLARIVANWNLDRPQAPGFPEEPLWYLPRVHELKGVTRLVLPVAQVVEWLLDLLGLPMEPAGAGIARAAVDDDSVERNLYNWLAGRLPHRETIERYFPDGVTLNFAGAFRPPAGLTETKLYAEAVHFARSKYPDLLAGAATEDERRHFVRLVNERFGVPSMRIIRQRLHIARMVQNGYRRLVSFLCPGIGEDCCDPTRNKVLQLVTIYRRVYDLTGAAYQVCGANVAQEDAWFEAQLSSTEKAGIYLSITPSRRSNAAQDLAWRLTQRFSEMGSEEPLEDLIGHDEAATRDIAQRDRLRLARQDEEAQAIPVLRDRLRRSSPWRALQAETRFGVVYRLVTDGGLPPPARELAIRRLWELSGTPWQRMGTLVLGLDGYLNAAHGGYPKDVRRLVENLLQKAKADEGFAPWCATVLRLEAKHHLAGNDFTTAGRLFREALDACDERHYGQLRGEIARDAFALEVANQPLIPQNHQRYYRILLSTGMIEHREPALQDVARELSAFFWDTLYRPYPGKDSVQPLAAKQTEVLLPGMFDLIHHGDWDGLQAWMQKHSVSLRDQRFRDVQGDTILMLLIKCVDNLEDRLRDLIEQAVAAPADIQVIATQRDHLHRAIRMVATAWPKLLDLADFKGQTPLLIAASRGDTAMVHAFLDAGADPSLQDYQGATALHKAAAARAPECIAAILSRRPDLGKVTIDEDHTALHTAVRGGHPRAVRLILDYQPDLRKRTNRGGQTALDLANGILSDIAGFRKWMADAGRSRKTGIRSEFEEIAAMLAGMGCCA